MKKIVVTGGTGLLGSALIRGLAANPEYQIVSIARNVENTPNDITQFKNVQSVAGDILDLPFLEQTLQGADVVIHTAAMVSFHKSDLKQLFEINVTGTENIVNTCLDLHTPRLIHVSSVASIGKPDKVIDSKTRVDVSEDYKYQDSPLISAYGKSKYLAELEVWRGQAEGLETVVINPSVILGEGDWSSSSTQLFKYVYDQNKFLTGGFLNYVDVKDVVAILLQLVTSKISNSRYIVNAGHVSYKKFFDLIAENFGVKAPSISLSKWPIEILWRLEALRSFLFGSKPLITKETALAARSNVYFDNQKIIKELGINFTPLSETIGRITSFLKTHQ